MTALNNHRAITQEVLPIAGFPVRSMGREALEALLLESYSRAQQRLLFFVNTNFVNQCLGLRPQLADPDIILVNDGVGMDIASWLRHRRTFADNLNGTDFVPGLLKALGGEGAPCRVFLLGGRPGIARRAARTLTDRGITVAGALDGYTEAQDSQQVVDAINKAGADVVLVAMGNPLQEQWILDHRAQTGARVLIGVGALLDFLAGEVPRAPGIIRRCRLEWLYRLGLEPRRLFRRYTVDIIRFLGHCRREPG